MRHNARQSDNNKIYHQAKNFRPNLTATLKNAKFQGHEEKSDLFLGKQNNRKCEKEKKNEKESMLKKGYLF